MSISSGEILRWPAENTATSVSRGPNMAATEFVAPGSNIALDLHGDPLRARAVVFSDGNHHMALEATLSKFLKANPDAEDVFYVTTPPRVIVDALKSGVIGIGNLFLTIRPHIFIGPDDVLEGLYKDGLIGSPQAFARSRGLSILIARGNPKAIQTPVDLLSERVRLAISNPVTEATSFNIYAMALIAFAQLSNGFNADVRDYLLSASVEKSQSIHHREIPQLIASGQADASLIYHHLALRYARIFPELFDLVPVPISETDASLTTTYHVAIVGDGGLFGSDLKKHLLSEETASIYCHHGLATF